MEFKTTGNKSAPVILFSRYGGNRRKQSARCWKNGKKRSPMQHEHYTHTAPDIPSSTTLSIFFFLLHLLLMQLLFLLLVLFQDFLHNLLCSRPILHTGQFDQQITHDHSIMGTANDKFYDAPHDNLEDDTHQDIHQVSHHDSTPSAVILRLILFRFSSQS